MDDLERQAEEVDLLRNIYLDEFKIEDEAARSYSIELMHKENKVYLCFNLPEDYPTCSPPVCEMSAPALTKHQKDLIQQELDDIYLNNLGETILYQWIEKVRDVLQSWQSSDDIIQDITRSLEDETISIDVLEQHLNCPEIIHGEIIEDRKSHFQAHVAILKSHEEIGIVLQTLKRERKILDATHNMVAWRLGSQQDCDDDGEKAAGSRLLHLLEVLNAENVIVVVSRWYGGIHLGPVRFRHINNAARQALIQAKIINQ